MTLSSFQSVNVTMVSVAPSVRTIISRVSRLVAILKVPLSVSPRPVSVGTAIMEISVTYVMMTTVAALVKMAAYALNYRMVPTSASAPQNGVELIVPKMLMSVASRPAERGAIAST